MNTLLATRHPASSLTEEEVREAAPAREKERQGSRFLLGSIALHAGLLLLFAGGPQRALTPHVSRELLEIEYLSTEQEQEQPMVLPEPETETETETALPLGALEAPANANSVSLDRTERRLQESPQVAASATQDVLTSDNPYATSDAAVFTSGSASTVRAVVSRQMAAKPSFGVSGGSARADREKVQELRSWYARVQGELARLGTRTYPRRALKLGQQGTAKVTVTIDESGNLVAASLAAGSGVASLDQAALKGVQSIAKVSAPPPGSGTNRLTVPVTFRIN